MIASYKSVGTRRGERGQTLILVALSLVSLLAMAALAIDVVSLYAARSEAQRAADAAALAGARAFVDSGVMTNSGLQSTATDMANGYARGMRAENLVAGAVPDLVGTPDFHIRNDNTINNPTYTVTITRTDLPLFFARIWGLRSTSVSATATAEAYNPSGSDTPVALASVKPWLVANCDPDGTGVCPGYFVDKNTGKIASGASFIGQIVQLNRIITGPATGHGGQLDFYAISIPTTPTAPSCPAANPTSCNYGVGSDDYRDNIACASQYKFSCGQTIGPGTNPPSPAIGVENLVTSASPTREGTRCLIHAASNDPDVGQDVFLTPLTPPFVMTGGSQNPNSSLVEQPVKDSDSVVTVPLYDGSSLCGTSSGGSCDSPANAQVIGFLQLGIQQTLPEPPTGPQVQAVVLNAIGCTPNAVSAFPSSLNNAVSGGGNSAIPVRLIQPNP